MPEWKQMGRDPQGGRGVATGFGRSVWSGVTGRAFQHQSCRWSALCRRMQAVLLDRAE